MADNGTIKIGNFTVNRIGLGTNRISDTPESHVLLKQAVEWGVTFIDTAQAYGEGESEKGIASALAPYADGLLIATKGGIAPNSNYAPDGTAEGLRKGVDESLARLKVDTLDLYQLHRVDPNVPIEESMATLKQLQDEGKIRHIGLSEVTVEQLKKAQSVVDIVSVQNEYNVIVRQHEELVDYCTEQGIVFIPWFPLGGLRGGSEKVEAELAELATKYDATAQQIALAWLLKRSPMILPIPGTLSTDHLKTNLEAGSIELSDEDYVALTEIK